VDSEPIQPAVAEKLQLARYHLAMSRHGEREKRRIGLDPWYFPHAFDGAYFYPRDFAKAREACQISEDAFFAVTIASNKGRRKNLLNMLRGWKLFCDAHPDREKIFYLHTYAGDSGGYNLVAFAESIGIDMDTLRFPVYLKQIDGSYTDGEIGTLMSAADVYLQPSGGEGFGVPIIEALACGAPTVVTNWTSGRQFGGDGVYKIAADDCDDEWAEVGNTGAFWKLARPGAIFDALEWANECGRDAVVREAAIKEAAQYEVKHVWETWWKPALESLALAPHYNVHTNTPDRLLKLLDIWRDTQSKITFAEFAMLHELAKSAAGPIVEIGAFRGSSTTALALGAKETAQFVWSIDPHEGHTTMDERDRYDSQDNAAFIAQMAKHDIGQNVRILNILSEQAAGVIDGPIDLLWIDGDHSPDAVMLDVMLFEPKTTGAIALHDREYPGVIAAIEELERRGWKRSIEVDRTCVMKKGELK
jgi:predicted O-methyltransferase YrrM